MDKLFNKDKQLHSSLFSKSGVALALLIVIIASTAMAFRSFSSNRHFNNSSLTAVKTMTSNGAEQWINDKVVTTPLSPFALSTTSEIGVSSLFKQYYQSHGAQVSLGAPITSEFLTDQGWMQFFASGALFLPGQTTSLSTSNTLDTLINNGVKDQASGIVRLSPLQVLLTIGSQVSVGGKKSTMTYARLRQATNPNLMQLAPILKPTVSSSQQIFLQEGTRGNKAVGHFVPQIIWQYIQRSDVSPDGWARDFGIPLTEALPLSITSNGKTHHLLIQTFTHDGLILDQDTLTASRQPTIQRLSTGLDYLHTVGLPTITISTQHTIWIQGNTDLLNTPDTGQAIAHVGQNFPLSPLGDTRWAAGVLWYHVQWSMPNDNESGWVSASAVTFTSPGNVPGSASLDALSPQLAAYLSSFGSNAGVVLYDVTRQRYYTYNSNTQFIVASSMKVPIMLTFFDMLEQKQQEPDDDQMNVLTTMIENSNNDSASDLYFDEIGGAMGVNDYLQKIGVSGLSPDADSWGYSVITPQAMVDMLTLLNEGKILNAQDRTIALNLMQNIEADQQVGVGDTAPIGSTAAMKDGWVTGPDNLWAMNSSGIVTSSKETYIISVYTQEQQSLDDGQAIVERICGDVASLLQ